VSRFRLLVDQIAAGNLQATHELYQVLSSGVRFFLVRELPQTQDVEAELDIVFRDVFDAIRLGEMREPERLLGFVLAVVRRRVAEKKQRNRMVAPARPGGGRQAPFIASPSYA